MATTGRTVGFLLGMLTGMSAAALYFLILPMRGEYHYVMEYPHTSVRLDKNRKIREIEFRVMENPHLPLYVSIHDRVLKLGDTTDLEEVRDLLRRNHRDWWCWERQKFPDRGKPKRDLSLWCALFRIESDNGKTPSRITLCPSYTYGEEWTPIVRIAPGGRPFVFPLDRNNVEALLGKNYRFRKQDGRL